MSGLAVICAVSSAKKIVAKGMNLIRQIGESNINITKTKSVTFVQVKQTVKEKPTMAKFSEMYPIEIKGKKVIGYKAVHKKEDGSFTSDYDRSFTYEIGKVYKEKCPKDGGSCSEGIHFAHKTWAVIYGKSWEDVAILEVESDVKDVVVSSDTDGKVRSSKVKIIRELPKDEY
jgi:hypothetical protein